MSDKIIRIIKQPRKNDGPRIIYEMKCSENHCSNIIKVRKAEYNKHSKKCASCSQRKRPFESIYNSLCKDHRKIRIDLSYDEFLEFTKIKNCHYCLDTICWSQYGTINNKFITRAYFLDRKDNSLGYNKENCVVCCTKCNRARSNKYTYEEWFGMTEYFRKKRS